MASKKGARKTSAESVSNKPMTAPIFIREFAARQKQLLEGMKANILSGEIKLVDDEHTDKYIERIISEWCDTEEPEADLHVRMMAAVFLWALLDEIYTDTLDPEHRESPPSNFNDLAVEVLRTIQAIWGKQ